MSDLIAPLDQVIQPLLNDRVWEAVCRGSLQPLHRHVPANQGVSSSHLYAHPFDAKGQEDVVDIASTKIGIVPDHCSFVQRIRRHAIQAVVQVCHDTRDSEACVPPLTQSTTRQQVRTVFQMLSRKFCWQFGIRQPQCFKARKGRCECFHVGLEGRIERDNEGSIVKAAPQRCILPHPVICMIGEGIIDARD
ncbi:hypothetical protein CDL60_08675 [Roseateles noduli]|nr:hypothetical protein CDL60_08675 [Roseateles noduli]